MSGATVLCDRRGMAKPAGGQKGHCLLVAPCQIDPWTASVCSTLGRQFLPQRFGFVKSVGEMLPEMITKNCLVQVVKVNVKLFIYLQLLTSGPH